MSERTEKTKQESSGDKSQISNNNTFSLENRKLTVAGPVVESLTTYMAANAENGIICVDSILIDFKCGVMQFEHNGKIVTVS